MFSKCLFFLLFFSFTETIFAYNKRFCTYRPLNNGGNRRIRKSENEDQWSYTIKYICLYRYELVGNTYATCRNGEWDVPVPVCVRPGCPELPTPAYATQNKTHNGAWVETSCMQGYKLNGSSVSYCNGKSWNATTPNCVASSCAGRCFTPNAPVISSACHCVVSCMSEFRCCSDFVELCMFNDNTSSLAYGQPEATATSDAQPQSTKQPNSSTEQLNTNSTTTQTPTIFRSTGWITTTNEPTTRTSRLTPTGKVISKTDERKPARPSMYNPSNTAEKSTTLFSPTYWWITTTTEPTTRISRLTTSQTVIPETNGTMTDRRSEANLSKPVEKKISRVFPSTTEWITRMPEPISRVTRRTTPETATFLTTVTTTDSPTATTDIDSTLISTAGNHQEEMNIDGVGGDTEKKAFSLWKIAVITIVVLSVFVGLIFLGVTSRTARGKLDLARLRGRVCTTHESEVHYHNSEDDETTVCNVVNK